MLDYIDQTFRDTRILIGKSIINAADFTVVKQVTFQAKNYEVTFGILAESHFVSLKTQDVQLEEVCICTDISVPDVASTPIIDVVDKEIITEIDLIKHNFTTRLIDNEATIEKIAYLENKQWSDGTYMLEHKFPVKSQGDIIPRTQICLEVREEELIVESIHTYPQENTTVCTVSIFKLESK